MRGVREQECLLTGQERCDVASRRQTKRKKKNGSKVLFIIEMLILLLLVGGIFAFARITDSFGNFYRGENTGVTEVIQADTPEIDVNEGVIESEHLSGFRNIALIGLDSRDGDLEGGLSDTMIIASINNDTQSVRLLSIYRDTYLDVGDGYYTKANAAHAIGSDRQLISMLNRNFDLAISDYIVVDFNAVAELVDDLGGIDIHMTDYEIGHMNNYCVETSEVTGKDYEPIPMETGEHHLNGVQAVAYARIRYTAGNDFKRTQRQRLVIEKIVNKAKAKGIAAYPKIAENVFPMIKTNLSKAEIVRYGSQIFNYSIDKTGGFPFAFTMDNLGDGDVVIPVTLAENVKELHHWLFDEEDYTPSPSLMEISDTIAYMSGYGEDYIEEARSIAENANPDMGSEADFK